MLSSIPGQNERWTQIAALQPPPVAEPGQNGGSGFDNAGTTAADPSAVSPVAGSTASPLSSNMSFMLMMFGGGLGSAGGSGSANGSGSATQTVGSPDDTPGQQGGTNLGPLMAELQSFVSSMINGTSAGTSTSASGTTAAPGGASLASNPLLQDLNSSASDLGTTVASADATQQMPPPSGGGSPSQSGGGNDITNTGTAVAARRWGDGPAGAGGGWQEQFLMAAYASGSTSGVNGATTTTLQSITV
jgi:hypothetical protein